MIVKENNYIITKEGKAIEILYYFNVYKIIISFIRPTKPEILHIYSTYRYTDPRFNIIVFAQNDIHFDIQKKYFWQIMIDRLKNFKKKLLK